MAGKGEDRSGGRGPLPNGIDPERLRELADKRNQALDQATQLIDQQKAAQQAIIDKMR